jgi:4-hydroxythreonine-4-phosphate dehydrogenase
VVPFTTHINIKNVYKNIKINPLTHFLKKLLKLIKKREYHLNFKDIVFICYNPHCGENGTLGNEDIIINNVVKKKLLIKGPISADSAFKNFKKNTLFITSYHDQGLIPFKSLNKSGINLTLGLKYRRLSPAHGTASDKKFKNKADTSSYISCMLF